MSIEGTPLAAGQMFDNFRAAKNRKLPSWTYPLLGASTLFVVAILGSMWVKTIWGIEQLELLKVSGSVAMAPAPPPPPPPPPGGAKPHDVVITKKKTVKDIVQPVKIEKQQETKQESTAVGEVGGEVGGVEGGTVGGDLNGVMGAPPPPPPPPPPAPPTNVAPMALETQRIAGEKQIEPSENAKLEIQRSGKDKVIGSFKLCIDVNGGIQSLSQLKSTGFTSYDQTIQSTIRGTWRYRPFMVNGKPAAACTAVTFVYSQK